MQTNIIYNENCLDLLKRLPDNKKVFKIKIGSSRIVILIFNIAIKIPNFLTEYRHFLYGFAANKNERLRYNLSKKNNTLLNSVLLESIFCSWGGLFHIQKRGIIITHSFFIDKIYNSNNIELFKEACYGDLKYSNFGIYKGKIVCLDYP